MKVIAIVLILGIITSCGTINKEKNIRSNIRKEILGRDFSNSDVLSIDIVEIEHPMLGGVVETINITENEKVEFLENFDDLEKKGMHKCGAKYVIRLHMKTDTLRLKACGNMISNRLNDRYYQLSNEKSIIGKYIKSN